MDKFDYSRQADLFTISSRGPRRMGFKRFDSVAQAVGFAIEELPAKSLVSAILEVDDERLNHLAIRDLYDNPGYPLSRNKKIVA